MKVFHPGQVLGRGDLTLWLQTSSPHHVTYTISSVGGSGANLREMVVVSNTPANSTESEFYAQVALPTDLCEGDYRIRWRICRVNGCDEVVEEFQVKKPDSNPPSSDTIIQEAVQRILSQTIQGVKDAGVSLKGTILEVNMSVNQAPDPLSTTSLKETVDFKVKFYVQVP